MLVWTVAQGRRHGFGALAETEGKAMPFDGVGLGFDDRMYKMDGVIDLLAAPERWCKGILRMDGVIDLLAAPERWCKGILRTYDGRHCIRGAIMAVDGLGTLRPIVLRAINEMTGRHYRSIEAFNDHPNPDHAQVVEVLARARTDLTVGHLAAIRARASAPVGWGRRMAGWIVGATAK
jgi:hypothetical protein